jgi:glycosyltransferase involved in cell wall biosynthesis
VAVLRRFGREPVSCVNAHSLSTLPLGWLLKIRTGAKLIYDTHELETETLNMKGLRQRLAKIVEAIFIRSADAVIVVGPRIADWYRQAYRGIDPVVVRNLPIEPSEATRLDLFRDSLPIKPADLIFFYQGVLAEGRGIGTTLTAFSRAPADRHVVFLGYGPMVEEIQEYSRHHPNIHFLKAVLPHEVRQYTQSGDIGLCLIEPKCLSYTYCMPNKLFEYMGAGVPAVVTALPELATIIDESGAGWTIENDAGALLDTIMSVQPAEARRRGTHAVEWAQRNSWSNECAQLRLPYVALGFMNKASSRQS